MLRLKKKIFIIRAVGDNTFRMVSSGRPDSGLKDRKVRRESVEKKAIVNARKAILEHFKRNDLTSYHMSYFPYPAKQMRCRRKMKKIVKTGSVRCAVYDDNDNCEVVYDVKYDGFKKLVHDAYYSVIKPKDGAL